MKLVHLVGFIIKRLESVVSCLLMVESQMFDVNFRAFSVGAAQMLVFGFSHRAKLICTNV